MEPAATEPAEEPDIDFDLEPAAIHPADEPDIDYDFDTGMVYEGPKRLDKKIGRITILRRGTAGVCVSIYCRMHQHSICKTSSRCPAHEDIIQWFRAGLDVPSGKAPALQSRHKLMFPK